MNRVPAVVVVAYDRPASLDRLLSSLKSAQYNVTDIPLVISIDGGANSEVIQAAEDFEWNNGEKKVITHQENLGLKAHVMSCGRLSKDYGAVIVLEDDLVVSPLYYQYAVEALTYCADDQSIAGISLFSYHIKEFKHLPFIPLEDGADNYFLQVPSSWGQIWTASQWADFENWMDQKVNYDSVRVPTPVAKWSDQSWKKDFIYYLVDHHKLFFYPRVSYTTNFGDAGVNHKGEFARYQVPISLGKRSFQFQKLSESIAKYDVFFEWLGLTEKEYQGLEFDLYGEKPSFLDETQLVLTTRKVKNAIATFQATMLPLEANYLHKVEGQGINLARKEDVILSKRPMSPEIHERLVGQYSKQRHWIQYLYTLKSELGL